MKGEDESFQGHEAIFTGLTAKNPLTFTTQAVHVKRDSLVWRPADCCVTDLSGRGMQSSWPQLNSTDGGYWGQTSSTLEAS